MRKGPSRLDRHVSKLGDESTASAGEIQALWEEYKAAHPQGWQYSVFCDQYRRWLATQEMSLRQEHLPCQRQSNSPRNWQSKFPHPS